MTEWMNHIRFFSLWFSMWLSLTFIDHFQFPHPNLLSELMCVHVCTRTWSQSSMSALSHCRFPSHLRDWVSYWTWNSPIWQDELPRALGNASVSIAPALGWQEQTTVPGSGGCQGFELTAPRFVQQALCRLSCLPEIHSVIFRCPYQGWILCLLPVQTTAGHLGCLTYNIINYFYISKYLAQGQQ